MPHADRPTLRPLNAALLLALGGPVGAQSLQEVVISANRQEQQSFDAPASLQAVGQDVIEAAGPRVNLSESLNRVPGITVLNRQNYAQDLQLSIRGSGSRSPFGIRGARLIVDGIPATMPDGQGQASTISLPSAQRIEVLRGPLAQLYGNSAGGVVQVFTADGPERPELRTSVELGPQGLRRHGVQLGGQSGSFNYLIDHSEFSTDGWRANSAAQRQHTNAKLRWQASDATRVTLVANVFDQPVSGDPLGLTREQFEADPRQAVAASTDFKAGKDVSQRQLGLVLDHRLDADASVMARVYAGQRDLDNRLAFEGAGARSAGGVVQLDRSYDGLGLRYSRRLAVGEGQLQFSGGLDHERMSEHRLGYVNRSGVPGELKRDEQDSVRSTGIYVQADWSINEHWSALAGLRANRVNFRVEDAYIRAGTPGNPDDSGTAAFRATNPVLGITRHLSADTNLYANIGRGFETPTFTEIAYTAGGSGPNLGLKSASSHHMELGMKKRFGDGHRLDVALFYIATRDEIVVATSEFGRNVFTNAGRTRRSGVEVAHSAQWTAEWRTHLALSTLNARFAEAFTSSSGAVVAARNRLPGTGDRTVFAELAWAPRAWSGFNAALELVHQGSMMVDDLNSDRTASATVWNLRLGWEQQIGAWRLRETLRIDNLSDRSYVGSVIANDGNRRFFEPAPGRQWGLGLTATYRF